MGRRTLVLLTIALVVALTMLIATSAFALPPPHEKGADNKFTACEHHQPIPFCRS
jgi:hypothetical protein